MKSSEYDYALEFFGHFDKEIVKLIYETGFPPDQWMTAGFRPKQDKLWWVQNGPGMVKAFIDWYESRPEITVWETPAGIPAIELPLHVTFGTVPVKMAIDAVFQAGSALIITDFKSGSRVPVDPGQLGMYASGIELAYGIRPRYGWYFMTRGIRGKNKEIVGYTTPPLDLSEPQFSVPFITKELEMLNRGIENEVYLPHVQELCRMCGVRRACAAVGGERAILLDPDHPDYIGSEFTDMKEV